MKTIFSLFFYFLPLCLLRAENVDIIANFSLDQVCSQAQMIQETNLKVRSLFTGFNSYLSHYYSLDVSKVFLMNDIAAGSELLQIPKEKLVLFVWEPGGVSHAYTDYFSHVYTYNDDLVDGVKYFKFYYPVLTPMCEDIPSFKDKKLCVMISHTASKERIKMIEFFETKPLENFEFFGFTPMIKSDRYRGSVPGHPLSQEKFSLLKQYRFCVCFENSFINGYITEKIFSCFAAGCVPIYFGAPNIEEYIPKECYIDYRDFKNNDELYAFITSMSEETYQEYLNHIREFLASDQAFLFSSSHFSETILNEVRWGR